MNIFKHEFKTSFKSVITWSVSIVAILFLFMNFFTALADDAEIFNKTLSQFPEELLIAFGMTGIDFSTVLGFFSFVFLFIQLCIAIQASNYGFGLVSVEERDLTADFLLTKPVKRSNIMTSKLLAALSGLAITNIVLGVSSVIFLNAFRGERTYETRTLMLMLGSIIVFELFFLTVGILISLLVKRVRNVTPYSMALSFGMYIMSAFSGMLGDVKLELITPFKHFEPGYIVANAEFNTALAMISVTVIILSITASYWLYSRRNIPSVT